MRWYAAYLTLTFCLWISSTAAISWWPAACSTPAMAIYIHVLVKATEIHLDPVRRHEVGKARSRGSRGSLVNLSAQEIIQAVVG